MTVKSISTLLLALVCAATALAQTATPPGIRHLPPRPGLPARTTAPTNDAPSEVRQLPVRSSSLSRSSSASAQSTSRYIAPTAKSDDLVESPATNVIKGAFGYTLGAIWNEPIPEEAEPVVVRLSQSRPAFGELGEVTFSVKPKMPFPPFETVTLSVSTNERRIAAIATETPRMTLAESYMETREKISEIAKKTAKNLGIDSFPYLVVTNGGILQLDGYHTSPVIAGKLYREYLKNHPNDPDKDLFHRASVNILKYSSRLIAGSRYNVRREFGDREYGAPAYLQQIWQLFELAADYYPYAGDAVIRFFVRDVEDRTKHTNLVSVAQLKEEKEKAAEGAANRTYSRPMRPGIVRRLPDRPAQTTPTAEEEAGKTEREKAEHAFKNCLYRLSFADAVEKAKVNDPEALLRIALAYVDGKDIEQDYREGRKYLEKACSLNYGYAQFIFALAGTHENWSHYLNRCRYFGINNDIYHLSSSYINGVSSSEDIANAVQYFELSVNNGVLFAHEDLDSARKQLKVKEEATETKRRNEELLKGAMPDGGGTVATQTNAASGFATPSSATGESGDAASTNRIQNICGIPLGGKLEDVRGDARPIISFFKHDGLTNDSLTVAATLIQNVRHFGARKGFWSSSQELTLLDSTFRFSGDCTIADDTIFSLKFESNNSNRRQISNGERSTSDSHKTYDRLRETLIAKYGETPFVKNEKKNKYREDRRLINAWQSEGLVITLTLEENFDKQPSGLLADYGEIVLQYIREDLLPKAKVESDAYEAAKKTEAERKAKADAEAWPEEMKKAMESL